MTTATMKMRRTLFRSEEPEWLVWLLVIVMLGIGLLARTIVLNQTDTFSGGNASVRYPAAWVALPEAGRERSAERGRAVRRGPVPGALHAAADARYEREHQRAVARRFRPEVGGSGARATCWRTRC